jgi:hypothetical protein
VKIQENIISEDDQHLIEKNLLDPRFPWHYIRSSNFGNEADPTYLTKIRSAFQNDAIIDPPQFSHHILMDQEPGPFIHWFTPILDKINYPGMRVLRMKVNLTIPFIGSTAYSIGIPHVDLPEESKYKTVIYYVTNSDGNTILFNETNGYSGPLTIKHISTPQRGKAIIFNGNTLHAACPPISNQTRIVLNINIA